MVVESGFANKIENEYIKKIISHQPDLFFQYTIDKDFSIYIDYLGGSVFEFYELSVSEIEANPRLVLEDRIHPDDIENYKKSIANSFLHLSKCEFEYRIQLPIAGVKWIKMRATAERLDDNRVILYGIKSDISIIKKQEEKIKIDELRSQFATMVSNVGVWDWNLATNEVYYSPESLKILELENNDVSLISNPQEWDDKVHPDDKEVYFGDIQKHFDGETPYYETLHRVMCNGNYKWILDRGKVVSRDENNKPLRIIGTHMDVSNQKMREQNLLDSLDLLNKQKNKLLNFAHIVSHNLKNHTGNLSSLLQLNDDGMFEHNELITYLKTVSNDLNNSIHSLVDLVKVQNSDDSECKELDLNKYLIKTLNVLTDDIFQPQVKIVNQVPKDIMVLSNEAYLESILLNLTSNAIRYSNPDKALIIEYFITYTDGFIILNVKDNGLGIDLDKYQDQLFGLYKTFHTHKDSNGVGLHITKNQIESMGGKIEVESAINEGSLFKIYFKK